MSWFDHQQEQALARGRVEGRAEGRSEGRADVLRKLLVQKFGAIEAGDEARIDAASLELLDRYLQRVLAATTLEAVFAE
ncbi:MAG: hypothetical protein H0T42_22125 [Deltaproteobacteria bacterium]|nr:hypothetical protein [Deltaproteobacteria bacterium]